jgi:uncharacterized protein YggE
MTRVSSWSSLLALTLAVAAPTLGGCASAGTDRVVVTTDPSPTGISVSGNGDVLARPDIGHIQLGVEARAATAEQAIQQVNAQMTKVLAALKAAGIADKDVRTNRVTIDRTFEPQPPPAAVSAAVPPTPASAPPPKGVRPIMPPPPPPPAAAPQYEVFRASNSVEATLRDLDRAGQVIGAAAAAGANEIGGLELGIDDPIPFERQARDKAVANARARAEQLAKLAGVKLGPVVAIEESQSGGYAPAFAMRAVSAKEMDVPVARGEMKIEREVHVRFAIEK